MEYTQNVNDYTNKEKRREGAGFTQCSIRFTQFLIHVANES